MENFHKCFGRLIATCQDKISRITIRLKKALFTEDLPEKPSILDIDCGLGMHTIELPKLAYVWIIALDFNQPIFKYLNNSTISEKVSDDIKEVN